MEASWPALLVTGAVGLGGALIGVGGSLLTGNLSDRAHERRERRAALVAYWAAVNSFAGLYLSWSELMPADANKLRKLQRGLQLASYTGQIVARLWRVTDELWVASGRLRAFATDAELAAVDQIEGVIGDWQIGTPIPEGWGPAIRRLRLLIEGREPTEDDVPAAADDSAAPAAHPPST